MPRTSPTFQSRLGLSGWVLWQATQAAPHADRERHLHHRRSSAAARTFRCSAARDRRGTDSSDVFWNRRQLVGLAVGEREIRDEIVADGAVAAGDQAAERDREGRRDRNGAGDVVVVGDHLGRRLAGGRRLDAAHDVVGIEGADVGDDGAGVVGLLPRGAEGQVTQVEPDRDGQAPQSSATTVSSSSTVCREDRYRRAGLAFAARAICHCPPRAYGER